MSDLVGPGVEANKLCIIRNMLIAKRSTRMRQHTCTVESWHPGDNNLSKKEVKNAAPPQHAPIQCSFERLFIAREKNHSRLQIDVHDSLFVFRVVFSWCIIEQSND